MCSYEFMCQLLYVRGMSYPGNLQFKMTNNNQQRLVAIPLLHFAHRSQNC